MIPYSIKEEQISLAKIKQLVQGRELLKSRRMLQEGIEDKFTELEKQGVDNLKTLNSKLRDKEKLSNFSEQTGIDEEYLVQLKREANSFISKPVSLNTFPWVDKNLIDLLASKKIKNSKTFFEYAQKEGLKKLATNVGFSQDELIELFYMCDLVRIWGVGGVFARIVIETGITSVSNFIKADPVLAYREFIKTNEKLKLTKALFIDSDIVFCNRMAQELEIIDIENVM